MIRNSFQAFMIVLFLYTSGNLFSQYYQPFEYPENQFSENNMPGWLTLTGDGDVIFNQRYTGNSAIFRIDPTQDKRNIWYAFAHQNISEHLDFKKLGKPEYQLRMEARVKTSHEPRRINMYIVGRKGDTNQGFLREFDIPYANQWTTISMVTDNINPDDNQWLLAQVSMMDWGISEVVSLEVDYIKVDVVSVNNNLPQYGLPLVYRPPLRKSNEFNKQWKVKKAANIDSTYPDVNFNGLIAEAEASKVLAVNNTGICILEWDFSALKGRTAAEAGQLELTTHSLFRLAENPKDFGEIRIYEILGETGAWGPETITWNSFFQGRKTEHIINGQTTIDRFVNPESDGITRITISKPVLDRLISGRTKGLAIVPLGYIATFFYSYEDPGKAPTLFFNLKDH